MDSSRDLKQLRPWIVAVVAVAIAGGLARVPLGVVLLGVVLGGLSSLTALGLVLIYRTARFINVATGSAGLAAAALVGNLLTRGWSFWLAALAGMGAGVIFGAVTMMVLDTRLRRAPRLVVMSASLGLAYIFAAVQSVLIFSSRSMPFFEIPPRLYFEIPPTRFGAAHIAVVVLVAVALIGLTTLFRRTLWGLSARAMGQDEDSARASGVRTLRISLIVWCLAGLLSAAAGILAAPILGPGIGGSLGVGAFLLGLAPAVVAGMLSLPRAVAAAVLIGVAYQEVVYVTRRGGVGDLFLLAVVAGAVLLRRRAGLRERESSGSRRRFFAPVRPLPAQMKFKRAMRSGYLAAVLAVGIGLVAWSGTMPGSSAQRLGVVAVFAAVALSATVVSAFTGHLSFGHWGIAASGAVVAILCVDRVPGIVGFLFSVVAAAVIAITLFLVARPLGTLGYAALTLAFAVAIQSLLGMWPLFQSGSPITASPLLGLEGHYATNAQLLAFCAAAWMGVVVLRRSRFGRASAAVRDDPVAASTLGLSDLRLGAVSHALSGAIAGGAGFFYVYNQRLVHAESFTAGRSLLIAAMVIVGGFVSPAGAVVAAAAIAGVANAVTGPWQMLGSGVGVLLAVLVLPGGLPAIAGFLRDRIFPSGVHPSPTFQLHEVVVEEPPRLELVGVGVRWGAVPVVSDVTLSVKSGEVAVITGTNGAGKSTLVRAMAGLVPVTSGHIIVDGHDVTGKPPEDLAALGIQLLDGVHPVFPELTVLENLRLGAMGSHRGTKAFDAAVSRGFDLFPELKGHAGDLAGTLSGGEQRLLALQRAMFRRPSILLIDEITTGLADELLERVMVAVRAAAQQGAAVVVVEHRPQLARRVGDRILKMDGGTLIETDPTRAISARTQA